MKQIKFKETEIGMIPEDCSSTEIGTELNIDNYFNFDIQEIKERIVFFQQMYRTLENDFLRILEYIPIDSLPETYSLKFISLISTTVNSIEDMLRVLVFRPGIDKQMFNNLKNFKRRGKNKDLSKNEQINYIFLPELLKFLQTLYESHLTKEKISLIISPFKVKELLPLQFESSTGKPKWYHEYNSFKHTQFENRKKATLENALNAIATFYILYNILIWELQRLELKKNIQWYNCLKTRNGGLVQYHQLYLRSELFRCWHYEGID